MLVALVRYCGCPSNTPATTDVPVIVFVGEELGPPVVPVIISHQ